MTTEKQAEALTKRITGYLCAGGLFNPELMDHEAVRDLLMDCRAELERLSKPGYVWMREEPTEAMIDAFENCIGRTIYSFREAYRAMIAAGKKEQS